MERLNVGRVVGPEGPAGQTGPSGEDGQGIAPAGTTGQILSKASDQDYDTEWVDMPEGIEGPAGKDGAQGPPGEDGFSPEISVQTVSGGHIVSITRKDNDSVSFMVSNGEGEQGAPGEGVPDGGSAGQILAKRSRTNYDTEWIDAPQSGVVSFKGRSGEVVPQSGDYTADMVGAVTMAQVNVAIQQAILDSWEASY